MHFNLPLTKIHPSLCQVLCTPSLAFAQLPVEDVWSHQRAANEEEAQVKWTTALHSGHPPWWFFYGITKTRISAFFQDKLRHWEKTSNFGNQNKFGLETTRFCVASLFFPSPWRSEGSRCKRLTRANFVQRILLAVSF